MAETGTLAKIAWLEWLRLDDEAQQRLYQVYRDYYYGFQGVPLDERQKKYLAQQNQKLTNTPQGVNEDDGWCLNYMALPVNVEVQRLNVAGFETGDAVQDNEGDDYEKQSDVIWRWWQANRMDGVQIGTYRAALVDGDTYCLVEWDDEKKMPRFYHEFAWAPFRDAQGVAQDAEGMKVVYSGNGRSIEFAAKRWREINVDTMDVTWRLNLYFPDRIEKYKRTGDYITIGLGLGAWGNPYEIDDWTDANGKPLGVPVYHFRYDDDGSNFGRSKIDDLIPVQNAINKTGLDVMDTSDLTAWQIITLSGGDAQDENGDAIEATPRSVLASQDGTWGYIPAGDIDKLLNLKNELLHTSGQIGQTPLSYYQITGQVSSAEGQKAGEANLIAQVASTAVSFGNTWEDAMAMGRKLSNIFGGGNMDEAVNISCRWSPFERIDVQASQQTEAVTKQTKFATYQAAQADGFSVEKAAELAGYSSEEARQMAEDKENEAMQVSQ